MNRNSLLIWIFAVGVTTTDAMANPESMLDGTWILDAGATERFVIGTPPRASVAGKLAEWFQIFSGYLAVYTYEFNGDKATMSAYRGSKIEEYRRISVQGTEIKYAGQDSLKTLSVSILNDGNIKIVPSYMPDMGYVLWKRGQLKTETTTPEEAMAAIKVWTASLKTIVSTLKASK